MPDIKDLEIKPYKLPGDPGPVQPITTCKWCGSALNEKETSCHNCGKTQINKGQPYQRKTPDKGESPSPFGTNKDRYVSPSQVVASKSDIVDKIKLKREHNHKNKDYAEHDPETLGDTYTSDPINQCMKSVKRKNRLNDDIIRKEEIMRSCEDLEIDG